MTNQGRDERIEPSWGNLDSLDIKPRQAKAPARFSLGAGAGAFVFICAVLTGVIAWKVQGGDRSPEMLGYFIGSCLGAWIFSYGIGWLMYRVAGRAVTAGRILACVLAVVFLLGQVSLGVQRAQQSKSEQDALMKEMQGTLAHISDARKSGGQIAKLESGTSIGGESGKIQAFMKAYLNNNIAQHNAYLAELEAAGWTRLLDPERMRKDAGLAESRATVVRAKATVAKHRQRWLDSFERFKHEAQALGSSATLRGFAKGVAEAADEGEREALQIWDLEDQIVNTAGELVELLATRRDAWAVENGQFAFSDDDSLEKFNSYVRKINALVEREEALQSARVARSQRNLERAGKL